MKRHLHAAIAILAIGFAGSPACSDDGGGPGPVDAGGDATATTDTTDAADSTTTPDAPDVADAADTGGADIDAVIPDVTDPPDTTPVIPPPNVTTGDPARCSTPGGDRNIYDIQDRECPDHPFPEPTSEPGFYVELDGVIVTGTFGDTTFVQDARGGPYSGIAVFNNRFSNEDLALGDVVNVKGYYTEFFELTQIYLDEDFEKVGEADVPEPYVPNHPSHLATSGPIAELFEGVLVRVDDVETIHTRPDCPQEFGEFVVTGGLRVDDLGFRWDARLGDHFTSITGPLHYTFGNFKVEPRAEVDLVWTERGSDDAISKCLASDCVAPEGELGDQRVVISEVMPDPFGSDFNQEWIELHNPGQSAVDVNGWIVRDCGDQAFTLSGPDLTISPGGHLVIGMSANTTTNGGVPVDMAYGNAFYLPNTVGSILIYDSAQPDASMVDQIRYSRFDPWDAFETGRSLERVDLRGDGTSPDNWASGTASYGNGDNRGTPGGPNSAQ